MKFAVLLSALSASAAFAAAPALSGVSLATDADGDVTVFYTVDQEAIVTYEFTLDGSPISGETAVKVSGCIGVPVAANTSTSFLWRASLDMPDTVIDTARLGVSLHAYGVSNPPPYAVVNLCTNAMPKVQYYSSTNEFPGGIFANPAYRTTMMVFKRVYAKNVEWLMGSTAQTGRTASNEGAHFVKMDHDYYLSVFELTKGQLALLYRGLSHSGVSSNLGDDWMFKPSENTLFSYMRGSGAVPAPGTAFGNACAVTGFSFDLPSEAEWEFAAKAGYDENRFPDGSPYRADNTNDFVRALANFNTNISFTVGSMKPNAWGFYDMMGNGGETCLDFYQADITDNHDGTPNVSTQDPSKCRDGVTVTTYRVSKGGYWKSAYDKLRPASRDAVTTTDYSEVGSYRLRLPCPIK